MGQVLHGCATTTEAVRRAIQHSQESLRKLARRYGINPKTVAKWKKRTSDFRSADRPQRAAIDGSDGRRRGGRSSPSAGIRFLPLDDCLYALQPTIPHLTRSSLHRCLQRHGISRLPDVEGDKPAKKKFKAYPIGYLPYRYRRGADRRRQTLSPRRHRQDLEVCLRRTPRDGLAARRRRLSCVD